MDQTQCALSFHKDVLAKASGAYSPHNTEITEKRDFPQELIETKSQLEEGTNGHKRDTK